MKELAWRAFGRAISRPPIADAIIRRAQLTPYFDLDGYMLRDWLFNGYPADREGDSPEERDAAKRHPNLPSIRIHHILREDLAEHPHDHPWRWARTIILRGWYREARHENGKVVHYTRLPGDTATLRFGEYHHIAEVSPGGVATMFIIGPYRGKWGFLVDGVKVAPRDYVAMYPQRA